MNFQNTLFNIVSIAVPFFAFLVVISKNPIFALLFLITSFLFSALFLFLMECELLALLFIIVYVGAIAILFLFAIMMLEFKFDNLSKNRLKFIPLGLFMSFLFLPIFLYQDFIKYESMFDSQYFYFNSYQNWYDMLDSIDEIEAYGNILYSFYVFQFLICGFILLLVLIGVVCVRNRVWNSFLCYVFIF